MFHAVHKYFCWFFLHSMRFAISSRLNLKISWLHKCSACFQWKNWHAIHVLSVSCDTYFLPNGKSLLSSSKWLIGMKMIPFSLEDASRKLNWNFKFSMLKQKMHILTSIEPNAFEKTKFTKIRKMQKKLICAPVYWSTLIAVSLEFSSLKQMTPRGDST